MAAECEAILLGREPIHGSANATALATLVKSLLRKSEPRRKYILRCTRDSGLQMSPYRRLEDEGFESDEDLTSLGSYEDTSSSMYVSDHALRVKHLRNHLLQQHAANGKSSQNGTDAATSGSVSSVGTDSANSSGASDNDDTDNSFSGSTGSSGNIKTNKSCGGDVDSECFSFHEVAFCHTDPSLPKVIVWVVKTRRQSKTSNEYSYGLEAIVFLCQNEQKFRTLYKNFQELSRRQKLDKPVRYRSKDMVGSSVTIDRSSKSHPDTTSSDYHRVPNSNISKLVADVTPAPAKDTKPPSGNGSNHAAMYNLVQRVDTDGVTHIEVTRPATFDRPAVKTPNDSSSSSSSSASSTEPSSIISINTPDSGDVKMKKSSTGSSSNSSPDKLIEGVIRADVDTKTTAPERPERKKQHKNGKEKAPQPPHEQHKTKEKVVRGQFVRVSVDQKTLSSPMASRAGIWLFGSEAKPCGTTLSYPSRLVWTSPSSAPENNVDTSRKSRRTAAAETTRNGSVGSHHRRSKSSSAGVFYRRSESPKRYPMSHRYIDTIHINNSLPNRFFGKLKELAGSNHNNSNKFRRRNSIGDLTNPTFYQVDTKKIDSASSLAKSTPNLKSVIKNKNSKFYKDGYDSNLEPKKVTFSAYATVQVVD